MLPLDPAPPIPANPLPVQVDVHIHIKVSLDVDAEVGGGDGLAQGRLRSHRREKGKDDGEGGGVGVLARGGDGVGEVGGGCVECHALVLWEGDVVARSGRVSRALGDMGRRVCGTLCYGPRENPEGVRGVGTLDPKEAPPQVR